MSEEKKKNGASTFDSLDSGDEQLEITVRKATNEVILRNPKDGKIVTLKANFDEGEMETIPLPESPDRKPLTPEEFEEALRELDSLGLKFTVDLYPQIEAKDEDSSGLIDVEALGRLQYRFPTLPSEAGFVAHNTLTGKQFGIDFLGGKEAYEKKSEIVKRLLLTDSYREDFFFKHALKVPSYEKLDWEIVLKTHERGVEDVQGMPYALLMLTCRNPTHSLGNQELEQFVSVAVNRNRIDQLIAELTKVRSSLDKSFKIRETWKALEASKSNKE